MHATPFDSDAPRGTRRLIIRRDPADGKPELLELNWGLQPKGPDDRPFRFVRSKGRLFTRNRCLVPASEFHVQANARRYRFALEDGNWFYLAGIWRAATGGWPASFAVITVPANPEVARYQDRQGALIRRNRHMAWLDHTLPEAEQLVSPPQLTFIVHEITGGYAQSMLAL
jgi:putative SOS response-associated peptidase YedK